MASIIHCITVVPDNEHDLGMLVEPDTVVKAGKCFYLLAKKNKLLKYMFTNQYSSQSHLRTCKITNSLSL